LPDLRCERSVKPQLSQRRSLFVSCETLSRFCRESCAKGRGDQRVLKGEFRWQRYR
jgi:hypothetical protein